MTHASAVKKDKMSANERDLNQIKGKDINVAILSNTSAESSKKMTTRIMGTHDARNSHGRATVARDACEFGDTTTLALERFSSA